MASFTSARREAKENTPSAGPSSEHGGDVRRLARVAQDTLYFAEAISGIIPDNPERAKARSEIEALLAEARSAFGEEKP